MTQQIKYINPLTAIALGLLSISLLSYGCKTYPSEEIVSATPESPVHPTEEGIKEMPISESKAPSMEKRSKGLSIMSSYSSEGMASDGMIAMSARAESRGGAVTKADSNIEPGQITAGEWNDLHNWEAWETLQENPDYREMQDHWNIYPNQRITLFLKNQYEKPIQDALIECLDRDKKVLWKSKTDNTGKAELWPHLFVQTTIQKSNNSWFLKITYDGQSYIKGDIQDIREGVNSYTITTQCDSPTNVDVMFVVDATGSMGDEINYLQSELKDVIARTSNANHSLEFRTGAVFYRDRDDEYLTRVSELNSNHEITLDFINNQNAAGGGDYPEAVEAALNVALNQKWSDQAIARILFLVLDAPPHEDSMTVSTLSHQIQEAAALGIRIIPITASGINRQTEFLMKYMALATNGTYVFVTDHSGIGNPHLDPVVEEYEVEKLNDLMVRLLHHMTQTNGCDDQLQSINDPIIKVFPNPTSNFITLSGLQKIDRVDILSNSGQVLKSVNVVDQESIKIDLSALIDGLYTVVCFGPDYSYAQPIVKVRG